MIIIGAGECGGRAALGLRESGYGGPVTLIGEEAHLPYERPPLSKEAMTAAETPPAKTIATAEHLAQQGIAFVSCGPVASVEPIGKTVHLADSRVFTYDKLLLATGAVPRRLPLCQRTSSRENPEVMSRKIHQI